MSRRWLLPQANPDVIRFMVTPTTSAKTVTLENLTAPCNCFIDWGDGERSAQIVSATSVSHAYADTSPRRITIHGVLGGFWNGTTISTGKTLVTSVDEINSRSLVALAHTFRGCTALATLPATLDAPNLVDFSYAFYQCRSITSALPALWLSHPSAAHASCFTDCFKSFYGQYGTACSYRQYVPAVAGQTYYQKYGQGGCPASAYHPAQPSKTYWEQYGASCPKRSSASGTFSKACPYCKTINSLTVSYIACSTAGYNHLSVGCSNPSCELYGTGRAYSVKYGGVCAGGAGACPLYQSGSSSYYSCSYFGGNCKGSGCTRAYTSGQSAYYRCQKSNATCPTTNCPYPCANEADVNAAKAAGWA